jgi:tellurite resistance protein
MNETKKTGIQETTEIIDFTNAYLDALKKAKVNDGKIDMVETLAALGETKAAAMQAAFGAWNVTKELGDLDPAEKDELLEKLLGTLFKVGEVLIA